MSVADEKSDNIFVRIFFFLLNILGGFFFFLWCVGLLVVEQLRKLFRR